MLLRAEPLAEAPLADDNPAALATTALEAAAAGDIDRAIPLLECAVGRHPSNAAWHSTLCTLYRLTNRLQDALHAAMQAVLLAPDNPDYLVNLSFVFTDLDERERAIACLLRALGVNAEHPDAHLAMAQNLLAQGNMAPGWIEYEWRTRTKGCPPLPSLISAPWNGMRLPTGRILLIGDQGFGDTLQFARYIPMVAERCAEVMVGCSAELLPLLRRIPGVAHADYRWTQIPPCTAYARLSSLPFLFQTTAAPWSGAYLHPDPARVEAWRERLPRGKRIGLCWAGRPTHPDDRRRSVSLRALLPLGNLEGSAFVSLQKPFPAADIALVGEFAGMTDVSEQLTDFDETAALIANLDLVITVDTAVAHLAGAMGRPCWIMLPTSADWRWMIGRSDSPWYPSMRLFRQPWGGEWSVVITDVAQALKIFLAQQTSCNNS